ncbi:hypothetical protein LUZ61_020916 [Rhynchospora tenuis]|uniref:Xylanase inhibitor C-terminal domain-containing protein n=1 Tax=Rhynchospora tenuis TaxID=198213 RepID=A0AAD5ZE76_9POAL|nr:hypothetical protein LUZ61_020916 [Rhynchospora tenuis]
MIKQKELLSTILLALPLLASLPLTLGQQPKVNALVAPITKESSTSLYTISLNSTKQLLVDLAGPVVWSTCPANYGLVQCTAPICNEALAFRYPDCMPITNGTGPPVFCKCTSSTKNPVTRACFADYVNICAPDSALTGLPSNAGLAINGKSVSYSTSYLNFDLAGNGGVKLSTTIPYTVMRSDIYKPFVHAYMQATKGIQNMPAVEPFELCFDTRDLGSTRVGYGVPPIDIMLNDGKNWTIFGANSLKDVMPNTACFAFVDGGKNQETAITLGGFQMEYSFLLFDVPNSTLGFPR